MSLSLSLSPSFFLLPLSPYVSLSLSLFPPYLLFLSFSPICLFPLSLYVPLSSPFSICPSLFPNSPSISLLSSWSLSCYYFESTFLYPSLFLSLSHSSHPQISTLHLSLFLSLSCIAFFFSFCCTLFNVLVYYYPTIE